MTQHAEIDRLLAEPMPYVPVTAEEKAEAFRLAAELFREVQKELEQDPPIT